MPPNIFPILLICMLLFTYIVGSSFEELPTNQLSFKSIILAENHDFISFSQIVPPIHEDVSECLNFTL